MNENEDAALLLYIVRLRSQLARQHYWPDITVKRVYRMRSSGILHAILRLDSNEYHVVYRNNRWRRA